MMPAIIVRQPKEFPCRRLFLPIKNTPAQMYVNTLYAGGMYVVTISIPCIEQKFHISGRSSRVGLILSRRALVPHAQHSPVP